MADNVLVGRIQCAAMTSTAALRHKFSQDSSVFGRQREDNKSRDSKSGKGCLNMAFKVDREMNQNGILLPEKFIRMVHWSNRRKYEVISEPTGARSADRPNVMAFSLSHAPTCRAYMHRFVESCGAVTCHGSDNTVEWGVNDAGVKAILCNNADEAVVISTTVIGNYPKESKSCSKTGAPYNDEVTARMVYFVTFFT